MTGRAAGPGSLARTALAYVAMLWAAGLAFGIVRELALRPALGPIWAQLAEAPVMAAAIWLAAGWAICRNPGRALAVGMLALLLLVSVETAFALLVLGQTPAEYLAAYDATRGTVFPLLLIFTALAPALRARLGVQ